MKWVIKYMRALACRGENQLEKGNNNDLNVLEQILLFRNETTGWMKSQGKSSQTRSQEWMKSVRNKFD